MYRPMRLFDFRGHYVYYNPMQLNFPVVLALSGSRSLQTNNPTRRGRWWSLYVSSQYPTFISSSRQPIYAASGRDAARAHTRTRKSGTRGGATICRRSRRCGPAIRRRCNNRGTGRRRRRMLIQRRDALRATAPPWSLSGRTTTTTTTAAVLICDRRGSNNIIRAGIQVYVCYYYARWGSLGAPAVVELRFIMYIYARVRLLILLYTRAVHTKRAPRSTRWVPRADV